jgi:hypothetical protein
VTIEEYLQALGRLLPRGPGRRRTLAEVEDHLREAAEEVGEEEEAVARFGSPEEVARAFADERLARATPWSALVVLLCLGGYLGAYLLAENALPPAPWPSESEAPSFLRWTAAGATWSFAAAAGAGVLALVLAALSRGRSALAALALSTLALALASSLALAGGLRRAALYDELDVAGRLSGIEVALGTVYLASLALAALAAAGWSLRVSWTARRASTS